MFDLPIYFTSTKIRAGSSIFLSEFVATFGLIAVIRAGVKFHPNLVFLMVASYITAAYWFTSSTSFANPAVSLARSVSNTFAGINPTNVPMFITAQLLGAFSATFVFNYFGDTKMKAKVYVTLKPSVLDPQGKAIHHSVESLGFAQITDVRQGKYFEIALDKNLPEAEARATAEQIAKDVLANPVIEDYRVEIVQ